MPTNNIIKTILPNTFHDILDLPHSVPIVDLFLPGFHEDFMMGEGRDGGGGGGGGEGTLSCTGYAL